MEVVFFEIVLAYANNPGRHTHLPDGVSEIVKRLPIDVAERFCKYISMDMDVTIEPGVYERTINCAPVGALYTALVAAHPNMKLKSDAIVFMLEYQSTTRRLELVKALPLTTVRQLALDIPEDHELVGYIARRAKKLMNEADELDPNDPNDAIIIARAKPKRKA